MASHESPAPPVPAPEPAQSRSRRLWAALSEAIRGSHQDFTTGSLGRAIFLLAVPTMLELLGEAFFAITDAFWVSRLGAEAAATVGLTEVVLTLLVFAVAIGLAMATTAVVARRYGEKKPEQAAVTAVQAIVLGVGAALVIGVPGAIMAPKILELMGASAKVVEVGSGYTAVMLGGSVTIFLIFLINGIYRGAGDASIAMWVLWLANGINIILDPCLIFGWGPFPELGLIGAAVATTTGRGLGVALQLWLLFRPGRRIQVLWEQVRLAPEVMWRLIEVSKWGILQFVISQVSWLGLVRILALFGSKALAGYTFALRIVIFTILPAWGLTNAAATLVGQNLGAGKPERAERSVWQTGLYTMIFLLAVAGLFIFWPRPLMGIFTDDPEVLAIGVDCLRTVAYGYAFYGWGMVMIQAFNGAGDTRSPTWINFFVFWMVQIPLAYALARPLGMGPQGVFWAIVGAESLLALVGALVFRRGRWKTREV